MNKQKVVSELKKYNNKAGVITPQQIANFFGLKKANRRVYRLTDNLEAFEGHYYLVSDIADEYIKTIGASNE